MKKAKKVLSVTAASLVVCGALALPAFAGHDGGVYEAWTWSKGTVGVCARFISGNNYTGNNPDYGATPQRYLKRTRVHLIEGNYDKTQYSPYESEVKKNNYVTASLTKTNNILHTSYAYWHWEYY